MRREETMRIGNSVVVMAKIEERCAYQSERENDRNCLIGDQTHEKKSEANDEDRRR